MERYVNLLNLIGKSSHFLFGARGTGKSYLIRMDLTKEAELIDLLHSETYLRLNANPSNLENMISSQNVVIDEIQRIPELLNEVHRLIENKKINFLLTGSSARQLKRKGVNLLAGRALRATLFPMTWKEISKESNFNLEKYLHLGGLPKAYLEDIGLDYLYAYVDTYLKEEIQAEALVRNLANYHRFLKAAAMSNSEVVNFSKIGNDAQLSPNTVRDYYQILEDTLLGYMLLPFKGCKRKAVSSPKFYLFDPGVANALLNVNSFNSHSDLFGKNFEQFLINEVRAFLSYNNIREDISYWRTQSKSKLEVDLIIGHRIAIEIKSSERVSSRDHRGLKAISEENDFTYLLLVSRDPSSQTFDTGIEHIYWESFLEKLWNNDFF